MASPAGQTSRVRWIRALKIAVTLALLGLIARQAGLQEIGGALRQADWRWLAAAVLCAGGTLAFSAWRWQLCSGCNQ